MPDNAGSYYPPVGFYFSVKIDGITGLNEGNFQEVSGLTIKLGTDEVKEGGQNAFVYKLPTPPKFENLVLKRGMVPDSGLITWARNALEQFKFTPKTVLVKLLNEKGNPLATWNFVNAYPVSLKVSEFKAQDNAIVVETLELAYNYFQRVK